MNRAVVPAALFAIGATALVFAQTGGALAVVRKVLLQQELKTPADHSMLLISVEVPAGGREGRHTHAGPLAVYVQEGEMVLESEGKAPATYRAGETFFVEAGTVHEGINRGPVVAKGIAALVSPRGRPVTTPVP